jgi:hypothetical protein
MVVLCWQGMHPKVIVLLVGINDWLRMPSENLKKVGCAAEVAPPERRLQLFWVCVAEEAVFFGGWGADEPR